MRIALVAVLVFCTLGACATTQSAPVLTDAERCARFGGMWSFDTCRAGN